MTDPRPSGERRQHPRAPGNIPVKILSDDFDLVTETKNLSRMGAYCRVNKFLAPMTKLQVNLLLSYKRNGRPITKKVHCEGIVVRIEPDGDRKDYHAAIYFHDIKGRDADAISEFVEHLMASSQASSE